MQSVNVQIEPNILRWVLAQTTEESLGEKMLDNIRKWLEGVKTPTFSQVETLSKKSHIPLGYFFLQEPPVEDLSLLEYRTMDSVELVNPSRDLIDTIKEMTAIQDWMREYRQEADFAPVSVVGSIKPKQDADSTADRIRSDLGLPEGWHNQVRDAREAFTLFRERLGENNVIVMMNGVVGQNTHRPLSAKEFRAFALMDRWAPLIFVNANDSGGARLFSLIHELVHVWIGESDLYNDHGMSEVKVKPIETVCNAVAAEILVPQKLFAETWNTVSGEEENIETVVEILAKRFRCGRMVIARRALDTKRISAAMYERIAEQAKAHYMEKKRRHDGGDFYNTKTSRLDSAFVRAVCDSVSTGRITYTEAYRLTATSDKTFSKVARQMGGVGV